MREFSHPGSKEKQEVDLNRAIESTTIVTRNEWKYVADLVTDFDPDLPPVACLTDEFNQAILNLIVNAAHAISESVERSDEKGAITITTCARNGWVEIRITDTGNGIPEKHRSRIFDPFFTTKPVGKGTGQGLAIVYAVVVEKHGGTIDCVSEIGTGTTFILRLPLNDSSTKSGEDNIEKAHPVC
jgi:signal transduction histidine kinase